MYSIFWTRKALLGYASILEYIDEIWTETEVANFEKEVKEFLDILSKHPEILKKQIHNKNLHRGPINNLTILSYEIKFRKKEIILLNIRSSRQKPLE